MEIPLRDYVTHIRVSDAARRVGIHPDTIHQRIRRGTLSGHLWLGKWCLHESQIKELKEEYEQKCLAHSSK